MEKFPSLFRNIVEHSPMSNNDEWVFYTNKLMHYDDNFGISRDHLCDCKLVISRPVFKIEVEKGLRTDDEKRCFDENAPEVTKLIDSFSRLKDRILGFVELLDRKKYKTHEDRVVRSVAHYISYNYYDCMSGGMPGYDISILRYFIENNDVDLSFEVDVEGDTFKDWMDRTVDVPDLVNILGQNKLPNLVECLGDGVADCSLTEIDYTSGG